MSASQPGSDSADGSNMLLSMKHVEDTGRPTILGALIPGGERELKED